MLLLMQIVVMQGYYWQDMPNETHYKALMLNGMQVGALNTVNGDYHIRQRNPHGWLGPVEPPIPRPKMNFGVVRSKVESTGDITKKGKPVPKEELESLLNRPKPLPLAKGTSPLLLPGAICGGLVAAVFALIVVTRGKRNGSKQL